MRPKVVFVLERWFCADPNNGLLSVHHNKQLAAFDAADVADRYCIFYDVEHSQGRHVDAVLAEYLERNHVDLVVNFDLYYSSVANLSRKAAEALRRRGIPVCCVWFDAKEQWAQDLIEGTWGDVDLNILIDIDETGFPAASKPNYLCLWEPVDPRRNFPLPADVPRRYDVSFLGHKVNWPRRMRHIEAAKALGLALGLSVHFGGGQTEENLTDAQYIGIMQQSKICLNFAWWTNEVQPVAVPRSPYRAGPEFIDVPCEPKCHLKGRVIEAAYNGAMLMDALNHHTSRMLQPGKEYVGFTDLSDFVEKIKYYFSHDDERKAIAGAAYRRAVAEYSPRCYWTRVFDKLGIKY